MKRLAAVLLALAMAGPVSADSYRFRVYIKWCQHYQQLMGLEDETFTYVHYHHPDYCAWVSSPLLEGFHPPYLVGLSEPDFACRSVSVKKLALHEMCHIRLHHTEISDSDLSVAEKHYEVRECMKAYEERDKAQ